MQNTTVRLPVYRSQFVGERLSTPMGSRSVFGMRSKDWHSSVKYGVIGWMACALVWVLCLMPVAALAQGLTTLLPSASDTPDSDIADIMRTAAENGVSVVVIDSDGRVLTQVVDSGQET